MKTTLTGFEDPFDFYVVAFINKKTRELESYYKNTWKRVKTPVEAMHFHTKTWAEKRAHQYDSPDTEAKVIRYRANFMSYEIFYTPADREDL